MNEALVMTDILMQPVVEGETDTPPSDPKPGDCWIVVGGSDAFQLHEHELACWQQGQWTFLRPVHGMSVYDRGLYAARRFTEGCSRPAQIDLPIGGSNLDTQARDAID